MIARTTAVVEPDGVLGELACAPPLTLRQVHGADRGEQRRCELRLVGTAAGPLAGDDLSISLTLRTGARATLRAAGASLAQGRDCGDGSGGAAVLSIRADLAGRADLIADPGALIICRGSRVDVRLKLALGAGAAVDWRELIVLGRTGEPPGHATLRWDVTRLGRPVLRQFVDLDGTALTAGRRVLACALISAPASVPRTVVASPVAVAQRVDDDTLLVSVLDDDAARAMSQLGDLCARGPRLKTLRPGVFGQLTVVTVLDQGQLDEFAERGFLVLRQVVPPDVVAAASGAIDELIERDPPDSGVRGPHNYLPWAAQAPALAALLTGSPAFELAESLTGPGTLERPGQMQVTLNIPPYPHRPGMHHLDGAPGEADGRPGTFTMLVGVLMSDQRGRDAGNLWVWPGTHLTHAEYFREHGPEAFLAAGGYPPIRLPEPEQVTGEAGDLLLAHYLLGHNIGGNTSRAARRAVYFRIKRSGHDPRWREFLQDPWLDYDAVRQRPG